MDWTEIACLAVSYSKHYAKMFLCLCEVLIEPYSCMGDSVQFVWFI